MGRKNNGGLPRHLLVLRTSAMGDVAMLPHALRPLLAAYPDLGTEAVFEMTVKDFPAVVGIDSRGDSVFGNR